jgi:hypothetical protein
MKFDERTGNLTIVLKMLSDISLCYQTKLPWNYHFETCHPVYCILETRANSDFATLLVMKLHLSLPGPGVRLLAPVSLYS